MSYNAIYHTIKHATVRPVYKKTPEMKNKTIAQ